MKRFLLLLFILLAGIRPLPVLAATVYTIETGECECFADSQRLTLPCTVNQDCTPGHGTHYYYADISEAGSYTFSASTGSISMFDSCGKQVTSNTLLPGRYYVKLSTGNFKGCTRLQVSRVSTPKRIPVKKLKLKQSKKTISVGKKYTIRPVVKPSRATNKKVCFRSSRKKVASVSGKGVVRAKKAGKTTITVTSKDNRKLRAKCRITVRAPKKKLPETQSASSRKTSSVQPPADTGTRTAYTSGTPASGTSSQKSQAAKISVSRIRLSASLITLQVGKRFSLHASILPTNATDKNVVWKSLNPSVASVSNGTVTAKKRGITTIIASSKSNPTCSCSCTVSVR